MRFYVLSIKFKILIGGLVEEMNNEGEYKYASTLDELGKILLNDIKMLEEDRDSTYDMWRIHMYQLWLEVKNLISAELLSPVWEERLKKFTTVDFNKDWESQYEDGEPIKGNKYLGGL